MTREELRTLTIEQFNGMTENQLAVIANEVIDTLTDCEISELSKDVRAKLEISQQGDYSRWKTWLALIISAIVVTIVKELMG